jgi:hypothetical protein
MAGRLSWLLAGVAGVALAAPAQAASHREAPLTSIDRTADITDWYAFVSPDDPDTVTMILAVDPLLEPSNGPNYFPFDDEIVYRLIVDNDNDAVGDVIFEVRFENEFRLTGVPVALIGAGRGVAAPANSPPPVAPGTPLIPRAITALDGPGSEGINLRQTFRVTLIQGEQRTTLRSAEGRRLVAVPSNAGPRTMPNYRQDLFERGVYRLDQGVTVFAGTADDAFFIDLGATFDSLNFRVIPGGTNVAGVLSDAQDAQLVNFIADDVAGFNVNTIAIKAPIALLTGRPGKPAATDPAATIGTYGSTSRRAQTLLQRPRAGQPDDDLRTTSGRLVQVQRMANPLFNELLIGTEIKDFWSRSEPADDAQFAPSALDPVIARVAHAATGGAFNLPAPPRLDLLPVVTYAPPIAAPGTPAGPVADLLRVNVGVPPTPFASASRLGLLGGDPAGFPNGRRTIDDVTDVILRLVVGGVLAPGFNVFPNNRLGDGVNVNFEGVRTTFPYVQPANSGRNGRHVDPGEPGCSPAPCPIN